MTDRENKILYIAEQCRQAGMTLAGAAGVIANVEAESAFKETNLQDTYERSLGMDDATYTMRVDNGSYQNFTRDAAGYGLAQWTSGDRKAKMLVYFRQRGKSIGDFATQVDFLLHEMRTGYGSVWSRCCGSNSPYECGYAVCKYYEVPANTEMQAQFRGQRAQHWYEWLSNNSGKTSTITGSGSGSGAGNGSSAGTGSSGTGQASSAQKPAGSGTASGSAASGQQIPKVESWPPRTVDRNCSGWPEVWLLQALLKCRGYLTGAPDGIFGSYLSERVKAFQTASALGADGVVGSNTWKALLQL